MKIFEIDAQIAKLRARMDRNAAETADERVTIQQEIDKLVEARQALLIQREQQMIEHSGVSNLRGNT